MHIKIERDSKGHYNEN